jgi:poly-gamma-glutamate capsule biosynthesis protein CapA/YwtB (metallophosphatase superfamily)
MTKNGEEISREVFHYRFEQVRYEARQFPLYDVRSVFRYLTKFLFKKHSVNPVLSRHFQQKSDALVAACNQDVRTRGIASPLPLTISMVGDIMWMKKGWSDFVSEEVLAFFQTRDIVLGNLETPVSADHKVIEYLPDLFSFNSRPEMLDQLARCFTAVSLVNNHCLDQGIVGLQNTIRELDARNILHAGACAHDHGREYEVIRKTGCCVAFLAYAWGLNRGKQPKAAGAVRLNIMNLSDRSAATDYSLVREHIRKARQEGVQLIICSLHWGHEYELYPTHHMMQIARQLISLGVDVIMGHHPHVLQPFELIDVNADRPVGFDNVRDETDPWERKAVVVYSLGNFVSTMYTRECMQSVVFNLDLLLADGRLVLDAVSCMPIYCMKRSNGEFRPRVVSLLDEMRKPHPPRTKRVFQECCRDITNRLGNIAVRRGDSDNGAPHVSCAQVD